MTSLVRFLSLTSHPLRSFKWASETLEAVSYITGGRGLLEEEVEVDWRPEMFSMLETEETRRMIESRWAEAVRENSRLYNASKFRLAGERMEGGKLRLRVGLTDYKDHVGTNLSPSARLYVMEGEEERYGYMSQCVGVGCWVLTTDSRLVMVENAAWKGEQERLFIMSTLSLNTF